MKDNGAVYLTSPHSRCGCANGALFCAHMGGLLLLLLLCTIQQTDVSFDDLILCLPEPILNVTADGIPVSMAYPQPGADDSYHESMLKRAAQERSTNVTEEESEQALADEDEKVLREATTHETIPLLNVPDVYLDHLLLFVKAQRNGLTTVNRELKFLAARSSIPTKL